MTTKRNIYEKVVCVGQLPQGSIINGCIAESFPDEEVYGLIITPRCDLAHEGKVTTVHYVPAIPFDRWFDVIARPIIKSQWKKDLKSKLNDLYCQAKVGTDIMSANLEYEDLLKICDEKVGKINAKYKIKENLDSFFDKNDISFDCFLLDGEGKQKNKHKLIEYLSRLDGNGIPAYYAIEGWPECRNDYLILMLRDVRRIEFDVAIKIKDGVFKADLPQQRALHNDIFLNQTDDYFYYVQAQIASPFIEHIMQAFVYNFSRIGVEDRPGDTIEKMFNTIKSTIK